MTYGFMRHEAFPRRNETWVPKVASISPVVSTPIMRGSLRTDQSRFLQERLSKRVFLLRKDILEATPGRELILNAIPVIGNTDLVTGSQGPT